jgi:hypothetical protein
LNLSGDWPHEWEQIDQGTKYCLRCPAVSTTANDGCRPAETKRPVEPKNSSSDTVRREIDRIARQLDGLTRRLKQVKESL